MEEREKIGLKFRLVYEEVQKIQDAILRMDVMLGNLESVALSSIPEEKLSKDEKALLEEVPDEIPYLGDIEEPKPEPVKESNREIFTVKNALAALQQESPDGEILLSDLLDKVELADEPKENQSKIYTIIDELIKKRIVEEAGVGRIKLVE